MGTAGIKKAQQYLLSQAESIKAATKGTQLTAEVTPAPGLQLLLQHGQA